MRHGAHWVCHRNTVKRSPTKYYQNIKFKLDKGIKISILVFVNHRFMKTAINTIIGMFIKTAWVKPLLMVPSYYLKRVQ